MHADSAEGKALINHYNISGFPSIVFVDKDSSEIDRIIGYLPPIEFLAEIQRIQNGINTIPDLIDKTTKNPNNFELWMMLASKYEDRRDLQSALEVWESVSEANIGDKEFVGYKIIELNAHITEDITDLEYFIADNLNSEYAQPAFDNIIVILRRNKDIEAEADAWRRYVNLMELKKMYTSRFYNRFAWRMSELDLNLDKALEKIRTAIQLVSNNDPSTIAGYMDTEAEILWKMGKTEDAINVIEECIDLQPDNQYFKDQKEKFLED